MSTPFKNTLRTGDQVFDVKAKRRAVVYAQPRESSRNVSVMYDGTASSRYVDVMDLRFIPPGQKEPEEVPPIEGEPPALVEKPAKPEAPAPKPSGPLQALEAALAKNKAEMVEHEMRFLALRGENDRIEKAIEALKA